MINWYISLIKQCFIFMRKKRRENICNKSCAFCKYWCDCKFIEDIDGIQTAMSDGYNVGYYESYKK